MSLKEKGALHVIYFRYTGFRAKVLNRGNVYPNFSLKMWEVKINSESLVLLSGPQTNFTLKYVYDN